MIPFSGRKVNDSVEGIGEDIKKGRRPVVKSPARSVIIEFRESCEFDFCPYPQEVRLAGLRLAVGQQGSAGALH